MSRFFPCVCIIKWVLTMKKVIASFAVFSLSLMPQYSLAAIVPTDQKMLTFNERQAIIAPVIESQQLLLEAYESYIEARKSPKSQQSELYAKAISAISRATAIEPNNISYLILASQIYRAKGGMPYAKEYFSRAQSLMEEQLAIQPNNIYVNLQYAIVCYSGDVRYWQNYDKYNHEATRYANKVIYLSDKSSDLREATAISYLIKGDAKRFEKIMQDVAKSNDTAKFYYTLYHDTVAKGQWLWPSKSADKEFLLYYAMNNH